MRVTVLGAGAWGTALAQVLARNGHDTLLWTWLEEHAESMRKERENREFLSDITLDPSLAITSDLEEAARHAELLVVVVPSHAIRGTLEKAKPFINSSIGVVCASKGIEEGSLSLMSEVIEEVLSPQVERFAVISGPSFAREVAQRVPTNVVAASSNSGFPEELQEVFATEWFRVYSSSDPVGVELGGALKNVIAVAAGASDGLQLGHNTRAALITRGIAEMARLVSAKGGEVLTTAGLAGMGDLVLTCTGDMSRNRTLGSKLAQGISVEEALASSAGVAEGYLTARSAHDLAKKLGVDLPICEAVYSVLHQGVQVKDAMAALLARPLRAEWGE